MSLESGKLLHTSKAVKAKVAEHNERMFRVDMNVVLPKVARMMEDNGFKNVNSPSEYEGILFQIVGEAKIGLQKMITVVRVVGALDENSAKRVADEFLQMHKRKSSYGSGNLFLYCLLTERKDAQASEWLLDTIYNGTHNPDHTVGAAGGRFLIADADSGWLYMNHTKEGVVKCERKMIEILLQAGIAHPSPSPTVIVHKERPFWPF